MPKYAFLIFFSIVLLIHGLVNFYIFTRAWSALPVDSIPRKIFLPVFLFFVLSYIIGRFTERVYQSWLTDTFIWAGAVWMAAMVYFLLFIFALDILRLLNHFFPFFPGVIRSHYAMVKEYLAYVITGVVSLLMLLGYLNAVHPKLRTITIDLSEKSSPVKEWKIVMASDIHLGTLMHQGRLERVIALINQQEPDLVLFPGDVIDEDLAPVIRMNLGETLTKVKAKYGAFAVTGNHEYIGGVEPAVRYLREHGITVLRDSTAVVADALTIVGREDISMRGTAGGKRKPLSEIVSAVDVKKPVILMDHQPFRLDEAEKNGIDLQVSGHTHYGQFWPFNYITRRVYELDWGFMKKGKTHYYISNGAGTWGPPIRIGNTPEIVLFLLKVS